MSEWNKTPASPLFYVVFCVVTVLVLKEVNGVVWDPYMDEPFHAPQGQAYCEGKWSTWDPKITTPPGLYLSSALLRNIFMFKCRLPLLRLVPALHLLALPPLLHSLELYHQRIPQTPDVFTSISLSAVSLATFPPLWFFGFLFYTDVPGVTFVFASFVAQTNNQNWLAATFGLWSLFFRQTNIIWVLYIFAYHNVFRLRWLRDGNKLHDPPALISSPYDLISSALSAFHVLPQLLVEFIPYGILSSLFVAFVYWNGGVVLGDKANHIPALHIPQLFYFYAFSTAFGMPSLMFSGCGETAGPVGLIREIVHRIGGTPRRCILSVLWTIIIGTCIHFFTIHHPFILSDNRHYTFYVWKRILFAHPLVPYALSPIYLVCWWAWWIRTGSTQSLLQTIVLPLALIPTLLPSPLLEPRYFVVPYLLLRLQVSPYDPEEPALPNASRPSLSRPSSSNRTATKATASSAWVDWALYLPWMELAWYAAINYVTMYVFLYKERVVSTSGGEEIIRFMW